LQVKYLKMQLFKKSQTHQTKFPLDLCLNKQSLNNFKRKKDYKKWLKYW
jgi:hypothetical protein